MPDKLPRWDCRNGEDQKALEAWTNARLDNDNERIVGTDSYNQYMLALEKEFSSNLKRNRVIAAVKNKAWETVARLADTEELRRLALPRKRGRPPGGGRAFLSLACQNAAVDLERIRTIWKQHYKKQNRSAAPTAYEIAARRSGIEPDTLINYCKNQHRKFLRPK